MLNNPYCSPSTSRAIKKSEANYFLPGLYENRSKPALRIGEGRRGSAGWWGLAERPLRSAAARTPSE